MLGSEKCIWPPVIMSGGAGTRLWPASRESMPKQFMPLLGELSSFRATLLRVADPAVKDLVAALKADPEPEADAHLRIHRPWGGSSA